MKVDWKGVYPAACTQFKADQSLDIPSTLRHLDAMIDVGIHGLVMLGTVGDNCSLEQHEKLEVLKHVNGRVPVLTRVAEYTTALACRFVKAAADARMDGLMVLPVENRLLWDLLEARKFEQARKVYQWYTPLLPLDTEAKLVQYIKLAAVECGFGSELTRAPRLPLVGEERAEILKLIRDGIANRPVESKL